MLNRAIDAFTYLFNTTASLATKFTIKNNVVTYYAPGSGSNHELAPIPFQELKQVNAACKDKPFATIQHRRTHRVMEPHSSNPAEYTLEQQTQHIHHIPCAPYTPADLSATLKQILKLQNDPKRFDAFKNFHHKEITALAKSQGVDVKDITINARDFISRNDAVSLMKEYRNYYSQYEKEIHAQFSKKQADLQWNNNFLEVKDAVQKGVIFSFFITTMRNYLLLQGIPKRTADHAMSIILLLMTVLQSDNYKPLFYVLMIDKLLSFLPNFSGKQHIQSLIALTGVAITSDSTFSAFTLGKLAASSLASLWTSHAVNRTFSMFSDNFDRLNRESAQPVVDMEIRIFPQNPRRPN